MATLCSAVSQVWNTTAGSKSSAGFSAAVGDLLVVIAASSGLAGGTTAVTDDNSSGTYTQVDSDRTGFSTTGVLTAWVRDTLIGTAATTIVTAAQVGSTGGGLYVYIVRYMQVAGTAAIRASGGQSSGGAGTTPQVVMSLLPNPRNVMIGAMCNGSNPAAMTPPPNLNEAGDQGYNSPATGIEGLYSPESCGQPSDTITWGSTSATAFASVMLEMNTMQRPVPAINHNNPGYLMEGLKDCWRRRGGILVPKLWTPEGATI